MFSANELMALDHNHASTGYLHFQRTLQYHESMLGDRARNRAFYRAIKKLVTRGTNVLDIGSGTGVWAITSALLGAARVVAIEKEAMMIPVINAMARENGVSDRIEVVKGDSREIKLKSKFDVVISETIGNQAFDEDIVPIMIDAKKRFLKPGGSLIPALVSLFAVPAHLKETYRKLPEGIPVQGNYMEFVSQNLPIMLHDRSLLKFLAKPRKIMEVDLTSVASTPSFEEMTASWKLADARPLNCFLIWAESVLTKGVKLSNLATSSWKPLAYPVEAIKKRGPAKVEFQISLTDQSTTWSFAIPGEPQIKTQSYSPIFPYMSIHAHIK